MLLTAYVYGEYQAAKEWRRNETCSGQNATFLKVNPLWTFCYKDYYVTANKTKCTLPTICL